MNKLSKILVAVVAMTALSTSVFAGSMSLGLVGSALKAKASGTETDRLTAGGANEADTSIRNFSKDATAVTGTIYIEYNTDMSWPISFGVEYTPGETSIAKKSRTDTELSRTSDTLTSAVNSKRTAEADLSNFTTLYAELPLFAGVYGKVGMSNITVTHRNDSGMDGFSHLTGINLGVGYKTITDGGYILKASYEETDYDSISLRSSNNSVAAETTGVTADVDTEAFRFSIGKAF